MCGKVHIFSYEVAALSFENFHFAPLASFVFYFYSCELSVARSKKKQKAKKEVEAAALASKALFRPRN